MKKMKASGIINSICILFTILFFSNNLVAQSKKDQILLLNHKMDSLQLVIKSLGDTIDDKKMEVNTLHAEIDKKITAIAAAHKKNDELYSELAMYKDSITKSESIIKYQQYQINQKNVDSLKYFHLISKLSEQNTFITDSLKAATANKKTKIEPTKIETFYFKDFKSVITGVPDEKNRYSWSFELFQKIEGEYQKSSNVNLFNDKKQELLTVINQKIQKDYQSAYKADPKCFKLSTPPMFDFKNLGIEFKDGKITFYASFDFANETCFYLYGYTSVEFTNEEIQQYLK
jgi:hypothetical protein